MFTKNSTNPVWEALRIAVAAPFVAYVSADDYEIVEKRSTFSGWADAARYREATIKWLQSHGIEFIRPPYYLSVGPPRLQPVGAGAFGQQRVKAQTQIRELLAGINLPGAPAFDHP